MPKMIGFHSDFFDFIPCQPAKHLFQLSLVAVFTFCLRYVFDRFAQILGHSRTSSQRHRISKLFIYPIKSCAGLSVTKATVTPRGFENDRLFVIVNSNGVALTQRMEPRLVLLKSFVEGNTLRINAPNLPTFNHEINKLGEKKTFKHFGKLFEGVDQGDLVANFLAQFLLEDGMPVRLLRMADDYVRKVELKQVRSGFQASYADKSPYMVATEASMVEVIERVGRELNVVRFRPNIVVEGAEAFEEDGWDRVRMGDCDFEVVKGCTRCRVPTVHPETGSYDAENQPTVALREFRSFGHMWQFGQLMCPITKWRRPNTANVIGSIEVGDEVKVLSWKNALQPDSPKSK